jgi:hypothetical protein
MLELKKLHINEIKQLNENYELQKKQIQQQNE